METTKPNGEYIKQQYYWGSARTQRRGLEKLEKWYQLNMNVNHHLWLVWKQSLWTAAARTAKQKQQQ